MLLPSPVGKESWVKRQKRLRGRVPGNTFVKYRHFTYYRIIKTIINFCKVPVQYLLDHTCQTNWVLVNNPLWTIGQNTLNLLLLVISDTSWLRINYEGSYIVDVTVDVERCWIEMELHIGPIQFKKVQQSIRYKCLLVVGSLPSPRRFSDQLRFPGNCPPTPP